MVKCDSCSVSVGVGTTLIARLGLSVNHTPEYLTGRGPGDRFRLWYKNKKTCLDMGPTFYTVNRPTLQSRHAPHFLPDYQSTVSTHNITVWTSTTKLHIIHTLKYELWVNVFWNMLKIVICVMCQLSNLNLSPCPRVTASLFGNNIKEICLLDVSVGSDSYHNQ